MFATLMSDLVLITLQGKIVVGHALHNDFRVLGINHPSRLVCDTAKCKQLRTRAKLHSKKATSLKTLTFLLLGVYYTHSCMRRPIHLSSGQTGRVEPLVDGEKCHWTGDERIKISLKSCYQLCHENWVSYVFIVYFTSENTSQLACMYMS